MKRWFKKREKDRAAVFNSRGLTLMGFACVAIVFAGFGSWAATAPLASGIIAQGQVTVDSKRKTVQHLEGGTVEEILVSDGENVEAGELLAVLDETQLRAAFAIVRGAYDQALAAQARLSAEQTGVDQIVFPQELLERQEVAGIVAGQIALHAARSDAFAGERDILEQRKVQLSELIEGLEAQRDAKSKQIRIIEDELGDLTRLLERGHTTRQRVLALQRERARLEGERGEHISDISRAQTTIGETDLEILQLSRARLEEVTEGLRDTRAQILDLGERLTAAEDRLRNTKIMAPVSGTVVGLSVHTEGAVIRPGETILEIVPGEDRLVVSARIRIQDVDNVAVGQTADIRLTAFKMRSTPTLTGEVTYVSADSLTDPVSGLPYFRATVSLDDAEIHRLDGKELTPGMPAEVIVKAGERTTLAYLMQPILDSMARAWREE